MVQFVVPGLQQLHQIVQNHSKVHEVCVYMYVSHSALQLLHVMSTSLGHGVLHGEGIRGKSEACIHPNTIRVRQGVVCTIPWRVVCTW